MSTVQIRPTFTVETGLNDESVLNRVKIAVAKSADEYVGQFSDQHAMIAIVEPKRHFWSPWMHLDVRQTELQKQIFCRFSPHPSIWTGFMFSYLAISVISFFAILFGASQQLSGQSPWAYWVLPIAVVISVLLWLSSQAGQRLAHGEMEQMKSLIEECFMSPESANK